MQTVENRFEAPLQPQGGEPLQTLEFGLTSVEPIPYLYLNVFTQTRKSNPGLALDELVASIESPDAQGKPRNLLLHPPFVNVMEPDKAKTYVADLNLAFGTSHSLKEAVPRPSDDAYPVVVAGHRRRLAIGKILTKQYGDPKTSTVASNTVYDMSFSEALRIQIDENVHLDLPVYETARAIQVTYKYGMASGEFKSLADCIRKLPFGRDKIESALRFCELPEKIQDWVEDDRLSYGAAVALYPALSALRQLNPSVTPAEREQMVEDVMITWALRIMNNRWGKETVAEQMKEYLASITKDSDLQLFSVAEYIQVRRARQAAYHELFKGGINRLRQFVDLAPQAELFRNMPKEHKEAVLAELQEFTQTLGAIATKEEPIQGLFGV